ncbi:hypothetical protein CEP51_001649 [Fusarium floridanum]|uniref:Uncharacterized protein n=1 Tax=Fusarium floridanum TaxID=1325733 RepID=A0A428SFH4_9HYPO|nr:hypothetical protein CEP51_001649 [Fusarium floridanum]
MHNIKQWQLGKGGASSRPDADLRTDVIGILKKIPKTEDGWAHGVPQTDEEVAVLFCKLTLTNQYSPASRKMMACSDLIMELANTLDSGQQLDVMTLIDACEVAVKQGELSLDQARELIRLRVDKPDKSLDGMRWGAQRFIRMLDELHIHGAVGTRAYEVAIRRPNALFRLSNFNERHMQILVEESRSIYRPQSQLDSTCLRVPNIVYVLFAGRFSQKGSMIASIAESRGWRIVNMDDWKPQLFRLEPLTSLPVSQGHISAAMLLQEGGAVTVVDHTEREIRWEPGQLLCYVGQGALNRNKWDRPFCLLVQLAVEAN